MYREKKKIGLPVTNLKMGFLLLISLFYILSPLQAKAGTWTSVGPYGGTVLATALSPNYSTDQTLFAGTGVGGVFKSTNGGVSWGAVNTGLSNLNVSSLSLSQDYSTDQTLFAGTYGSSVWKYTDIVCSPVTYYQDADSDTYGNASVTTQACTQPIGYVMDNTDCDDNNAAINPGYSEVCNGVDDNCNRSDRRRCTEYLLSGCR